MTENDRSGGRDDVRHIYQPAWFRRYSDRFTLIALPMQADARYDERGPSPMAVADVFGRAWFVYSPVDKNMIARRGCAGSHAGAIMDADDAARKVWGVRGEFGAADAVKSLEVRRGR